VTPSDWAAFSTIAECPPVAVASVPAEKEVGAVPGTPCRVFGAHVGGELVDGEHVQLGRDAKDGRLAKVVGGERVRVCVDQPAQQGLPLPVLTVNNYPS
jgi:hypothetical protein